MHVFESCFLCVQVRRRLDPLPAGRQYVDVSVETRSLHPPPRVRKVLMVRSRCFPDAARLPDTDDFMGEANGEAEPDRFDP